MVLFKVKKAVKEQYINVFKDLIAWPENEVAEFKKAENNFDFDDLGKYFSALSNEANLRGQEFAWLIFGYDEKKQAVVGTSYKCGEGALRAGSTIYVKSGASNR